MRGVKYNTEYYEFEDGSRIVREFGKTPNGNPINGKWVYRDAAGDWLDFDMYRSDLMSRNRLSSDD